jgi:hypothetical protein
LCLNGPVFTIVTAKLGGTRAVLLIWRSFSTIDWLHICDATTTHDGRSPRYASTRHRVIWALSVTDENTHQSRPNADFVGAVAGIDRSDYLIVNVSKHWFDVSKPPSSISGDC